MAEHDSHEGDLEDLRRERDHWRSSFDRMRAILQPDCPDAEVCRTCLASGEDDVCLLDERLAAELERLRSGLARLADQHHRTFTNSRRHDPNNREWTECDCRTCAGVRELLDSPFVDGPAPETWQAVPPLERLPEQKREEIGAYLRRADDAQREIKEGR